MAQITPGPRRSEKGGVGGACPPSGIEDPVINMARVSQARLALEALNTSVEVPNGTTGKSKAIGGPTKEPLTGYYGLQPRRRHLLWCRDRCGCCNGGHRPLPRRPWWLRPRGLLRKPRRLWQQPR